MIHKLFGGLFIIIVLVLISHNARGERVKLNYQVLQGSKVIGVINIEKDSSNSKTILTLNSAIDKHVIFFHFSLLEKQQAEFIDNRLSNSYFFRKVNGTIKADKYTFWNGNVYKSKSGADIREIPFNSISYNQAIIYTNEPVNCDSIYSDYYEAFMPVRRISEHTYVIKTPEGNNMYYYTNGICDTVKIKRTFFSVEFKLINVSSL